MTSLTRTRIESIDLLKGIVIVIMALDHTRDYFHFAAFYFNPTDPTQTSWPIFFTRWITHFCAPTFSFLAGLSAFMVGKRKSKNELAAFLFKRGLWLVFIEIVVVSFGWFFDPYFRTFALGTIWSLGISMIFLAGLIYLPQRIILAFSCVLIFGHNLLDTIHFDGNVLWAILHERNRFPIGEGHHFGTGYSLIPWVAVMSLGYCFGSLYDKSVDVLVRRKILNRIGIFSLALFCLLIAINRYGDLVKWTRYDDLSRTFMSILNVSKYPPSLLYLLITLGPSILFLANSEKLRGKVVDFFTTFGRVPFFFYIIHIYLIHFVALFAAEFTGFGWQKMILPVFVTRTQELKGYGFKLWIVYMIWIGVILLLYPFCKKFDRYKQNHKEKWWLSYL